MKTNGGAWIGVALVVLLAFGLAGPAGATSYLWGGNGNSDARPGYQVLTPHFPAASRNGPSLHANGRLRRWASSK